MSASNVDDMPQLSWVYRRLLHKDAKLSKLITREDNLHIHKTLGLLALLSFIYRYAVVYPMQGDLGFDGERRDWATMLIHSALACSSILFRIPKRRIPTKPMVIYEEYRQHGITFSVRCLVVYIIVTLLPEYRGVLAPLGVMIMHLIADRITSVWGTEGNTAVRATSGHMKLSYFYRVVAKGYSFYQFLAIASHIVPSDRHADMAYNAIIAIQSSAFMMTLYRKRIIRGTTHMVVYAFCLLVSSFHIVRVLGPQTVGLTLAAFILRINLPRSLSNKYVIWSLFLVAYHWSYLSGVVHAALEAPGSPVEELAEVPTVRSAAAGLLVYAAFKGERLIFGGKAGQGQGTQAEAEAEAAKKDE